MTEGLKPASPRRVALAIVAALTAMFLLGAYAVQSDQRGAMYHAAYDRVCDAAGAPPGKCVEKTRELANFQTGAAVLGSQDAATFQAQIDAARAEGRAEGLSEQLSQPVVETHHAPPDPRPQPRAEPRPQRLDRRVCAATGLCPR